MRRYGNLNLRMADAQRSRVRETLTGPRNTRRTFGFSTDFSVPFYRGLHPEMARLSRGTQAKMPRDRGVQCMQSRSERRATHLFWVLFFFECPLMFSSFRSPSPDECPESMESLRTQLDTGRRAHLPSP
jgi:hypothetical protein